MSPEARALLEEQRRQLETLDARRCERLGQDLLARLARGEAPLPGIDARVPSAVQARWSELLLTAAGSKLGLCALALVGLTALGLIRSWSRSPEPHPTEQAASPQLAAAGRALDDGASNAEAAPSGAIAAASQPSNRPDPSSSVPPPSAANLEPRARATPVLTHPSAAARTRSQPSKAHPPDPLALRAQADEQTVVQQHSVAQPPGPSEPAALSGERAVPPGSSVNAETGAGDLAAELALLRKANALLHAGKAQAALQLLDEHVARFPQGQLAESRELTMMLALCAAGREPAARVRAEHFLALHPRSAYTGRVRAICPK